MNDGSISTSLASAAKIRRGSMHARNGGHNAGKAAYLVAATATCNTWRARTRDNIAPSSTNQS